MADTDADRDPVAASVRVDRGAEVAWTTAVVLALGLAVAVGPGLLQLLASLGAVVALVRLHALLDPNPPGGVRRRTGPASQGTR